MKVTFAQIHSFSWVGPTVEVAELQGIFYGVVFLGARVPETDVLQAVPSESIRLLLRLFGQYPVGDLGEGGHCEWICTVRISRVQLSNSWM